MYYEDIYIYNIYILYMCVYICIYIYTYILYIYIYMVEQKNSQVEVTLEGFVLRLPTLTTIIQYSFGSFSHSNQRRKRNKRNPNRKRRSKAVTVCR